MPCALLSSSSRDFLGRPVACPRRAGSSAARRGAGDRLARDRPARRPNTSTCVIVQRVQRRGGRRRHPGGVGAGLRMADLLRPSSRPCGRAPPTCPCRSAPCPTGRAAARSRRCAPHRRRSSRSPSSSPLRIIGPARIEVWISSPVRSRKPVLMNTMRSFTAAMHAARLARGAALLVHHADLDRVARQRRADPRPRRTGRW